MDAESGRVLYGKNAAEQMAMASTTKILTAITVIDRQIETTEKLIEKYKANYKNNAEVLEVYSKVLKKKLNSLNLCCV